MKKFVTCAFVLSLLLSSVNAEEVRLNYGGDGYPAAGMTETISVSDGYELTYFFPSAEPSRHHLELIVDNLLTSPAPEDTRFFIYQLSAPLESQLDVGMYANATYPPFETASRPSFLFSANNRSDSFPTSVFSILQISFDDKDKLTSLALDFTQTDYYGTTYGSLRYNSDIPLAPIPEPSTYAMMTVGLTCLGLLIRRRKQVTAFCPAH